MEHCACTNKVIIKIMLRVKEKSVKSVYNFESTLNRENLNTTDKLTAGDGCSQCIKCGYYPSLRIVLKESQIRWTIRCADNV